MRVLLLCHNHLRRHSTSQVTDHHMLSIGDLPIEIVKMILVKLGKNCQVEQTLLGGIHAAPDLKPVELPENAPIEMFIP